MPPTQGNALKVGGVILIAASIVAVVILTQIARSSQPSNLTTSQGTERKKFTADITTSNTNASNIITPSPSSSTTTIDQNRTATVRTVDIPLDAGKKDMLFEYYYPSSIKVRTGDTVTWINKDTVSHTVTSVAFNSGQILPPPQSRDGMGNNNNSTTSFSFTFDRKGVYSYFCQIHPYMSGTVYVDADETQRNLSGTVDPRFGNIIIEIPQDTAYNYKFTQGFFIPANALVPAGSRVTWVNSDYVSHTATATDGSFDTEKVDPRESKTLTINQTGRIAYYCAIHPWMQASLTVFPAGGKIPPR